MPISMSESAHYVTQSSCFDVGYCGPLTDRKIRKYQKKGYFGQTGILALRRNKARKKRAKSGKTKTTLEKLVKYYTF